MARPRLAITLWLAGLVLCIVPLTQTRFVADLSLFLPATPTTEQRWMVDQLRDGAITRVMLIGIEGADAPNRARLSRALVAALEPSRAAGRPEPLFATVANGAGGGHARERELLLAQRYVLSPGVTPQRFTVEGLRAAVAETVDLLASPAGLVLKGLATRDPTGEMLAVIEQLRPSQGPRLAEGVWAAPDGERALLFARTLASGADIDAQARAVAAVEAAFRDAGPGAARLILTGPGVFAVRSREMIKRDVERLAVASLALVATILLLVYRSPLALGLGLVPVVSGALAGTAAVALGFGTVHGITLGFGTTLIGEAVDYSIYLFVQSERSPEAGDGAWIRGFWPTIRIGVLTSIAGFSALLFSGLPGLAQLGLYSIVGLAVAAIVTRFVLPALLPASFRIRDVSALGARLLAISTGLARARWLVAILAVGALAVLATHRGSLWDAELSNLNPISAADRRHDGELRAALQASDARLMIAVRAASAEAALQAAERVGARLEPLVAAGRLGGFESPAKVLPSLATQRARLASLPEPAELRRRLAAALTESPLRADRLEPFVADMERARSAPPLTREQVSGTALGAALEGLLFADDSGRWTALIGLRAAQGAAIDPAAVRSAIGPMDSRDAMFIDLKLEVDRLYAGYFDRALAMSAVGLAAIVVLLLVALRSPGRVVRVLVPLAAGVLCVAAWHVLGGTRLSLLHLVGLLLVVAIGSNYALFFDRIAERPDGSAARTLASLTLANVTTVASFGVLAISDIPVLNAIGSTVALGAFVTLLFTAMTLRADGLPSARE